jgi:hypothetical protein
VPVVDLVSVVTVVSVVPAVVEAGAHAANSITNERSMAMSAIILLIK